MPNSNKDLVTYAQPYLGDQPYFDCTVPEMLARSRAKIQDQGGTLNPLQQAILTKYLDGTYTFGSLRALALIELWMEYHA